MRPASAVGSRSGSVTSMVSEARRASSAADFRMSRRAVERLRDLVLGEVDRRTLRLALVRRHLAERRQQCGDRALLAERGDAHRFEGGLVAGCSDIGENGLFECCKVGHGGGHLRGSARGSPATKPSSSAKADDPVTPGVNDADRWLLDAPPSRSMTPELDAASDFRAYAASAALAFSAIAWNAAGSVMARSDSTLRSTVMPDFDRPLINTL